MSESESRQRVHWQRLRANLFRFIRSKVPNREIADDLTQETLLKIARRIESLREEERLQPWAFRIARNTIADFYRKSHPLEDLEESLPSSDAEDYAKENFNHEVASWLPAMIEELPEEDRNLITLTEIEGLSQREVATRRGASYSAIKSRVQRARAKLKKSIQDCCLVELDGHGNVIDYAKRSQTSCDCQG